MKSQSLLFPLLALLCCVVFVGCTQEEPRVAEQPTKSVAAKVPAKPSMPVGALFRPEFETIHGTVSAGTAFVIQLPGDSRPILLSALHLLGPDGGLSERIKPTDVGEAVSKIRLTGMFEDKRTFEFDAEAIVIPDAASIGVVTKYGDVIAFKVPKDIDVTPLKCAAVEPERGESVWLYAEVLGGASKSQKLHRARVINVFDGDLLAGLVNEKTDLRATSGSVLVNSKGEAVAIHLGGGIGEDFYYCAGNPISRFRELLEQALADD